jgi:lysozyme
MKRAIVSGIAFFAYAIFCSYGSARAEDEVPVLDAPRSAGFKIIKSTVAEPIGPNILGTSLTLNFAFPTNARADSVFGIDISHYTKDNCGCPMNWDLVASKKIVFVYSKVSDSNRFTDPAFESYWRGLENHPKIYRGAYHFLRPEADPVAQAKYYLALIDKAGKMQPRDLPPGLDLEWTNLPSDPLDEDRHHDAWMHTEPDEIISKVLKWLEYVKNATGRTPIIYTNAYWWTRRIKDEKKIKAFEKYPIWISDYSKGGLATEIPTVPNKAEWLMWQFSSSGDVSQAGIRFPTALPRDEWMDVSIVPGTLDDFRRKFNLPPIGPDAIAAKPADPIPVTPPPIPTPPPVVPAPDVTAAKPADPMPVTPPPIPTTPPVVPAPDVTAVKSADPIPVTPPPIPTPPPVVPAPDVTAVKSADPIPVTPPPGPTPPPLPQTTNANAAKPVGPVPASPPPIPTPPPIPPVTNANAGKPPDVIALNNPTAGNSAGATNDAKIPNRPGATTGANAGDNVGTDNKRTPPQNVTAQKTKVEIVLLNGRIVRVDTSIDPAVLKRLIAAVEGN